MKAVQFKFGGDHTVVDVPKPQPAADEVLVKVMYSALDTTHDACLKKEMTGYFVHKLKEPLYLGYHYSGVVEEVGSDVTTDMLLTEGAEVFGFLQYEPSQIQGAFAEYIVVKWQDCAIKPSTVSHKIAAASTTESITALQAMRDLGGLEKGQSILINGAGGGVGASAVQIAKLLGAHVTAICSTKDVARVKEEWGADVVVDRTKEPNYFKHTLLKQKQKHQFNVIFDTPSTFPSSATGLLLPKGAVVKTFPTMSMVVGKIKTLFSSKKVTFVECHSKQEDLTLVGKWLEGGDLTIPIDSTFPIKDIQAAMTKHAGKKTGRVVIQVGKGW